MNHGFFLVSAKILFVLWQRFAKEAKRRQIVGILVADLNEQIIFLYSFTRILYMPSDKHWLDYQHTGANSLAGINSVTLGWGLEN